MILTTAICNCDTICDCPIHVSDLPKLQAALPVMIASWEAELSATPRRLRKQTQYLKQQIEESSALLTEVQAVVRTMCA